MAILCFDLVTGAAGNMVLGALLDLGVEPAAVDSAVRSAGIEGFSLSFERSRDCHGLLSGRCEVHLLHTHEDHHHHRGLSEVLAVIGAARVPERAKARARAVFHRLAEAEAAVHQLQPEAVHFHEVGAVDAIVDVLGTCVAMEALGVDSVYCSAFKTGHGTVRSAHGQLPIPAPATVKLLEGHRLQRLDLEAELTTPTGAAILTTLSAGDWGGLVMRLSRCGIGRGTREFAERPNILRAFLAETGPATDPVEVIETDIDDESPEVTAALPDLLREAGALDATLTPLVMKKGRAGIRLTVIARLGDTARLADLVFRQSSTIGLRIVEARRLVLPREGMVRTTPWGDVRAKRIERPGGIEVTPEFDSARELARATGVPLRQVMHSAHQWSPGEDVSSR